ncbi:right-handed parallel beta-helix repeat-containing protein [Geobacter sp. DSM 9736]|uniref:right-handed parallel beta-helix repeat-containing protein n=1 Tax=Geobacter sp. DSM 9736 TaxID=1277350 RepID=UPI000B507145|nr:right-handed parallel beta-helix repeat-containing protein [Geobacter sp. DSM 9736]SNB46129.1 hypothetical protein SAMN06269301_1573 [Geobacter sp. DSM 9736]
MKTSMRIFPLLIVSLMLNAVMASASWGATFYLAPNGNDTTGDGSQNRPWRSLSYACSRVTTPGDTIYIGPGNYTDNGRCNLAVGVSIAGAGSGTTKITSAYNGGMGTGYIFRDTQPTNPLMLGNNEISGFTLDGSNKTLMTGVFIRGSSNLSIHDMKFQSIKVSAIWIEGYYNWSNHETTQPPAYAKNVAIYNVETYDTTSEANYGWGDRLGAFFFGALENAQIYNITINEAMASRGTGIKAVSGWLKNFKGYNWNIKTNVENGDAFVFEMYNFLGDSEIYNCVFNHALSLNSGPQTPVQGSTWNLKIHDTKTDFSGFTRGALGHELSHNHLDFYNNYIYGNRGRGAGLWTTNYLTAGSVTGWRFRNNIVQNCSAGGLTIDRGNLYNIQVYNNIFDTMSSSPYGGYGISTDGFNGQLSGMKIQNNVFMNCAAAPIYLTASVTNALIDHNIFYNNGNGNNVNAASASTIQSNNIKGTVPGLVYSGNRPDPYYQLSKSSNLLDAGVDVGLPYSGKAPDIGAIEYQAFPPPRNLRLTP